MAIQVTIKDGYGITLDELVGIVPLSRAAKDLNQLQKELEEIRVEISHHGCACIESPRVKEWMRRSGETLAKARGK